MFEDLSTALPVWEAESLCAAVLKGTFMENGVLSNVKTVARYLAEIGEELGISAPDITDLEEKDAPIAAIVCIVVGVLAVFMVIYSRIRRKKDK